MNMKKEVQGFIGTLPFDHASNRVYKLIENGFEVCRLAVSKKNMVLFDDVGSGKL